MAGFFEELLDKLGPSVKDAISSKFGLAGDIAEKILPQIAPLIMGGLKKEMTANGGDKVNEVLDKYGDKKAVEDPHAMVAAKADEAADPGLGGLLGDAGSKAAEVIAEKLGIAGDMANKLISSVGPVVLGYLSQKREEIGKGATGILSIIDKDGDGEILDDVGEFISSNFHKISSMLGSMFGGEDKK